MTFVPYSRILPRSLWRPALFFFAVAQVFLSFAPVFEGRQGPDARAHVEESGTTLHHAHNESDCTACTARLLLASADPERPGTSAFDAAAEIQPVSRVAVLSSAWTTLARSRAPPSALIS